MNFSIITPSLNQLAYLKRSIASVRDQALGNPITDRSSHDTIHIHHHIQDGGSTDGTVEFLQQHVAQQPSTNNYELTFVSEADSGMYDALNKGFSQSSGDIFAWLNCDEQYLPGTLSKVARYFVEHADKDMVCGDALLVKPDGRLITYRKNPPLRRSYILADHLYAQSAALFFRSRVFETGLRFHTEWKAVGDCDLVVRALKAGFRAGQLRDYLSACAMTGENLSRKQIGREDLRAFRRTAPCRYRLIRPVWNTLRYLEKFLRGGYSQAVPLNYELYVEDGEARCRIREVSVRSRFRWDFNE